MLTPEERLTLITRIAKAAARSLGVEYLSIAESPLPGGYFVVTTWFENKPCAAVIWIADSRESEFKACVEAAKYSMLKTMLDQGVKRAHTVPR